MHSTEHIPGLGHLGVVETFVYYDRPRLYVSQGQSGQRFLVVWVEETEDRDVWLYAPISSRRLRALRAGALAVRDVFADVEGGTLYRVVTSMDGSPPAVSAMETRDLSDDMLPRHGMLIPAAEKKARSAATRPPQKGPTGSSRSNHRRARSESDARASGYAYRKVLRGSAWYLVERRESGASSLPSHVPERAFSLILDLLAAADRPLSFNELHREVSKGFDRVPPVYWFRVVLRMLRQHRLVDSVRGAYFPRDSSTFRSTAKSLWQRLS